jgi:hypothetical protein
MEATKSERTTLGPRAARGQGVDNLAYRVKGGTTVHPCEHCKCCSCARVCTRCSINCSPEDSSFIPVIGCPEFKDMREIEPVRYLYRGDAGKEFRLRLPRPR